MARKHKRHSLNEFWVGEMPKPQEPEKKSKQKKIPKNTDIDAANRAISLLDKRVEKKAIEKAQKYCSAFYKEEFRKALKQAMRQTHLSRSERMRRARLPIDAGGFMGFARDENIPDY